MYALRSSFFWSNSMTQSSTANNRPPMNSLQALGLIWKVDLVYDARPATMRSASNSFGYKPNRLARWQPWLQFVLSENQNDLVLDMNFRQSAMWSKRTSQLDDIPRIWGLKWHTDSSGCHEDPPNFSPQRGRISSSNKEIAIIRTLNVDVMLEGLTR